MRRKCQECRLKKCLAVGMRPECVVPETQCAIKRKEKKAQKEKDKQQIPPSAVVTTTDTYKSEIPSLMKCDPPPHAECTVSINTDFSRWIHIHVDANFNCNKILFEFSATFITKITGRESSQKCSCFNIQSISCNL